MRIGVLGAGSWGTALATALASQKRADVVLWARDPSVARDIAERRINDVYLPEIVLDPALSITSDFDQAASADLIVIATPVAGLRSTAERLARHAVEGVVWVCKGLEERTRCLPHQVIAQALPGVRGAALSGPSFAAEVAQGWPCAVVLASSDARFSSESARLFHGGALRVYVSDDVVGVEIGGAVKNVMAIATGISDGLGLGLNARAALVTRGLAEITRLGLALGARRETFMGLAGVGDLLLTCTGDLSRNRTIGIALGRGEALGAAISALGHVAEGVRSAQSVRTLAQEYAVAMPITDAVCKVLEGAWSPRSALQALLAREPTSE